MSDERTDEQFYDEEIAPELSRLATMLVARGMPLSFDVGFGENKGATYFAPPSTPVGMRMVMWASRANGNADLLIAAMIRDAEKNGHGSVYLKLLQRQGGEA